MIQINLFCPGCHRSLAIEPYARTLRRYSFIRQRICHYCGYALMTMDIIEPAHRAELPKLIRQREEYGRR